MTVNKHAQVRAALCWTKETILHVNIMMLIISIPARFTSIPQVLEMVDISTDFEGGRQPYQMRLKSIKSRCF
jgi:ribose 5-phosphate isomerase B